MHRVDPSFSSDELTMLGEFLDYHRLTLAAKLDGLTQHQLARRLAPGELTIAGLVKHLAYVEDHWFQVVMVGRPIPAPWAGAPFDDDPDWELHSAGDDSAAELRSMYAASCDRSRAVVDEIGDPEARSSQPDTRGNGEHFTLRWILLHMIEETARHNGHADLIRESIDGVVGE